MEEEETIIIQVIFKLEDGRLYNFDVDRTITFYETKKILSNATHILKNSFTLFHNGQEYSNEYNELPLIKIFPSLKKIEFSLKMDKNKQEQDENEHEQISVKYNIKEPCREHIGKFLVLYCISCKKSICNECFSISHNNHEVEEKADYLMPAKILMERIFANSYMFKSDPKFSNYMSCVSFRSIIKTEIFDRMRQLINELENKCINCLEYFSFNEDSTEKNNDLNLELLKKYCTSSFIKLKNNIDTKEILIHDEIFLSLYNKLKAIKNYAINLFTENSNKYKMLNQLFVPFTQAINNMSIDLNNFISRYINNDIFAKFANDISKYTVDVVQKEDVNRFMFKNIKTIKSDENYSKNYLTPNINSHRILPSILLFNENKDIDNINNLGNNINVNNNNVFNQIPNNSNNLDKNFKYQQSQESSLFSNHNQFSSKIKNNIQTNINRNPPLFNNNLFNNQPIYLSHFVDNNLEDMNHNNIQNIGNMTNFNFQKMYNNTNSINMNIQNSSISKSFNISSQENLDNSSNMNIINNKNSTDNNINNPGAQITFNSTNNISETKNCSNTLFKSLLSNNNNINISNCYNNINNENSLNNNRNNFMLYQSSKEITHGTNFSEDKKAKLEMVKNEIMEIEESNPIPNINSPFIPNHKLNNTQAQIEEIKANLSAQNIYESPIEKKPLISVHLSPYDKGINNNISLQKSMYLKNDSNDKEELKTSTIKQRIETSCHIYSKKNLINNTNIYDNKLNDIFNKEKKINESEEKRNIRMKKNNSISNFNISKSSKKNIISSLNLKEKYLSQTIENTNLTQYSVSFMYPIFKTDIIKIAINKNSVQEKKMNFSELSKEEPIITEFPNGGAYCNYENNLFFSGGQEYIKGAGKLFLSTSKNAPNRKVTKLPFMKHSHWNHSMIGEKGKIYVIGGFNSNKCEFYDIYKKEWSEMPDLIEKERQRSMLFVKNNFLYCFMGLTQNGILDTVERINLNNIETGWEIIIIQKLENINLKFYGAGIINDNKSNKVYFIGGKKENKKKEIVFKRSIYEFSFDNFEMIVTDYKIENDLIFVENKLYSMDDNDCGNFINIRNGYLISMFNLFK